MRRYLRLMLLSAGMLTLASAHGEESAQPADDAVAVTLSPAELEAAGAIIGRIIIDRQDVFDTSDPRENKSIYRLANRWHIETRESVIAQQLLFQSGEQYSARLVAETERLLRANGFLYAATISALRFEDGVVDLRVWTRDVWTLTPGISASRTGGENRTGVKLAESNLLGLGIALKVGYADDVDRTSTIFAISDNNLGDSWVSAALEFVDSSDGGTTSFNFSRPFYSMDARWAGGTSYLDDEREVTFYDLGNEAAEYRSKSATHSAFWGWSKGLVDSWVKRFTTGFVFDDRKFSAVPDGQLPTLDPEDRRLVYPFIGIDFLEDEFETASNRNQIERVEDFYLGTWFGARLGFASESFGADRSAIIYSTSASQGFGSIQRKALFLTATASGRVEGGDTVNSQIGATARYYNQITEKSLFFATLDGLWGNDLDLDNLVDLGGDSGLRGYPLRYQTGSSRALMTVEQRYFTDWYPFRLFRVGGAVFADVGRTWGDNPVGGPPLGWLRDLGVGLRLGSTRSSARNMVHIDIAFPLDGDPSIDRVQFLVQSKRSF